MSRESTRRCLLYLTHTSCLLLDMSNEQDKDKEHKLYTTYSSVPGNSDFQVGKNEYFPFPRDFMNMNPALVNVGGWASAQ